MNTHSFSPLLLALAAAVLASACSRAEDGTTHAANTPMSNGASSDRTAMSQSNAKADLDHLAEIRKSIVADDDLSVAAQNVQVLTNGGNVLLRGKVASTAERAAVERHARAASATRSVDDQLEIESK